jgi:hypothetical protein
MKRLILQGCLLFAPALWPSPALPGVEVEDDSADLATDPQNCGRAGHDCGGGACVKGACQKAVVQDGIVGLGGFAVDASGVYYTSNPGDFDARLLRCPVSGCTLQPDQLASGLQEGAAVQLGLDDVFFGAAPIQATTRNSVYTCPKTGCTAPPIPLFNSGLMGGAGNEIVAVGNRWFTSFGGGILSCLFVRGLPCERRAIPAAESPHRSHGTFPLAADAGYVYFGYVPPVTGAAPRRQHLMACPHESDCSAPTLLAEDLTPDALAAFDGTVYILRKGGKGGAPSGSVLSCAASGCGPAGPAVLIRKLAYPTALAADASGVYWYTADAEEIAMCPLAGCGGGARTVVSHEKGVTRLVLSGAFVYWSASGPESGRVTRSTIYRIAK